MPEGINDSTIPIALIETISEDIQSEIQPLEDVKIMHSDRENMKVTETDLKSIPVGFDEPRGEIDVRLERKSKEDFEIESKSPGGEESKSQGGEESTLDDDQAELDLEPLHKISATPGAVLETQQQKEIHMELPGEWLF